MRGYTEVTTPNIFNMQLWNISGHAQNYKQNMFVFEVEKQEYALKPMNCPGHCLMFGAQRRSYREMPLRFAEFGVLHRNEFSGALTGLTRVRRFVQDDAHIFCRSDQLEAEIAGCLDLINHVFAPVNPPPCCCAANHAADTVLLQIRHFRFRVRAVPFHEA